MNVYGRNLRWITASAVLLLVVALAACEGERTPVPSSQAYSYAAACSNITAKFDFTLASFASGTGLTWGRLVELADANISGYSLLYPPPDLEDYNTAQINLLTALRDKALAERSDGVILRDLAAALGGALPPPGAALDAAAQQGLAQFFGPQFVQAFVAQQAAVGGLSSDLQALVTEANCTVRIG